MSGLIIFALLGSALAVLVVFAIIIWIVLTYNKMISLRNGVDESWAQIETQLQRRYDLIPNLVETVKGYASHEEGTLEKIVEARNAAGKALQTGGAKDIENAEKTFSNAREALNITVEAYPDLKASSNFGQLQEELASTENKVSFARQNYNNSVYSYNTAIQSFPGNVLAGRFNFHKKDMFELENVEARKAPEVKF